MKVIWEDKYKPQKLNDYIFQDPIMEKSIRNIIGAEGKSLPHLLLSGIQGSGKTSLSDIIINERGAEPEDVLTINASDENSVDTIRTKIKNFIGTIPVGDFKIVQLEECDHISMAGQGILRKILEQYSLDVTFILTCNYAHKVIPALKSRCREFTFKAPDKNSVTMAMAQILISEDIKFDLKLLDQYVDAYYPDIRKTVGSLQQYSIDGVLEPIVAGTDSDDYKFEILDLLKEGNWEAARVMVCANITVDEYEGFYKFLYTNLEKFDKFGKKDDKWSTAVLKVNQYLYQHMSHPEPEINLAALFIELSII